MAAPRTPGRFFFHRDHLLIVVGAFVLLGVVSFVTLNISFLNPVSKAWKAFSVTDLFFDIQHYGPSVESPAIAVVDISDVEDRGDLAVLLERVALCDPACMGVDAIFEGLRSDEEGNARLVDAVRTYGDKMIFTCKLTDYDRQAGCFTSSVHSFFADSLPIREGYANLKNNLDNLPVRKLSVQNKLGANTVKSFPAAIVEQFAGRSLENHGEDWLINYRNVGFRVIAPDDIEQEADFLEGKIVLLGGVREERDAHVSPLGKMPGVMIQAYTVDTLLGKKVRYLPSWINWILAFVLCFLFQVTVEALVKATGQGRRVVPATFLRESRIVPGNTLFLFSALLTYLTFVIFTKWGFCIDIAIVLTLFALTLESRKLYRSSVIALSKRYSGRFLQNSIYT